jgi:hypothetical protein
MEAGKISLLSRLGNNLPNLDSSPKRTILVAVLMLLRLAERTCAWGGGWGKERGFVQSHQKRRRFLSL